MSRVEIGKQILDLMDQQGLDQIQLAELAGIRRETVNRAIHANERVGYGAYCKLAQALGTTFSLDTK